MSIFTPLSIVSSSRGKVVWLAFLTLLVFPLLSPIPSFAQGNSNAGTASSPKFGFVNTDRIFREAAPAKKAELRLETEFKKRELELTEMGARLREMGNALEKDAPVISDAQRRERQAQIADLDREFQRKQRDFRDDVGQRRQTEFAEVLQAANRAIKQIAEKESYDAIFQDAVFINPRLDITDKVIKALSEPSK